MRSFSDSGSSRETPDRSLERPGTVPLAVAVLHKEFDRRRCQAERHLTLRQPLLQVAQEDVHDLPDILAAKRVEDDGIVHPVEELGVEGPVDLLVDLVAHVLVAGAGVRLLKAQPALRDVPRAQVRGHDEDGVLEVDHAPVVVGQVALVEDLQEDVEDIGVGPFRSRQGARRSRDGVLQPWSRSLNHRSPRTRAGHR